MYGVSIGTGNRKKGTLRLLCIISYNCYVNLKLSQNEQFNFLKIKNLKVTGLSVHA